MSIHVTGYGAVTPLGKNAHDTLHGLEEGLCAVRFVPEWSETPDLHKNVAGFVDDFSNRFIARKTRRTMSKMSEMICLAADEALGHAQPSRDGYGSHFIIHIRSLILQRL